MTHQQQTALENIEGKGEITRKEQFLLFPQCFLCNQIIVPPFVHVFDIISLFTAEIEKHIIGRSGKGLTKNYKLNNRNPKVPFVMPCFSRFDTVALKFNYMHHAV